MKEQTIVRVSMDLEKKIKDFQHNMRKKYGVNISFVQASKAVANLIDSDKLIGSNVEKKQKRKKERMFVFKI